MLSLAVMKNDRKEVNVSEMQISLPDFLESFNKNMPTSFPRATTQLLKKFKDMHLNLFTHGDLWSLDRHRKKIIDWLPRNSTIL